MKPALKKTYKILRAVVMTTVIAVIAIYALLYILLSIPSIQQKIKREGEKQLTELLNTKVTIGDIKIMPFNRVMLYDVIVPDQEGKDLLKVDKLGAGVSIANLILKQRLVFTYAEVIGLEGHVTRKDKDSPTNLQFIIDAFKKKPKKEPTKFDIKVHNIVIRNSLLTYDVESETPVEGKFDPNHVEIKDLRGDFELPILKNEHFKIGVKRMSFNEKSGFQLKNLVAEALITDTLTKISKLKLQLPNSLISPDNIELHYSKLSNIATELPHRNLKIGLNNNKITPSDFAAFYPQLKSLSKTFNLNLKAQGNRSHIDVSQFQLTSTDNALYTKFHGSIDNVADKANMSLNIPDIELVAQQGELLPLLDLAPQSSPKVKEFLTNCGNINLKGSASGSARSIDIDVDIKTLLGNVNVNGNVSKEPSTGNMKFDGHVQTPLLDIGKLLSNNKLGEIAIDSDVQAVINNNSLAQSTLDGVIDFVDFNGARYHNITAHVSQNKNQYEGELSVDDPKGVVDIKGNAILNGKDTQIDLLAQIDKLRLSQLNVDIPTHGADVLSMNLAAHLTGNNLDNATGSVEINDLDLVNSKGKRINLNNLTLNADNSSTPQVINVHSPILNGYVKGKFDFKSVASSVKNIMANTFPDVYPKPSTITGSKNNFDYYFVIKPDDRLSEMVNLPVKLIHDAEINGTWNEVDNDISCDINLPYLLQGKNKIIEGTSLHAQADVNGLLQLNLHTLVPAKNEKIAVNIASTATNNNLNTDVAWRYDRVRDYHGNVNTTAHLKRDNNNNLAVNIDVNPTQVIANDTAWKIHPGQINYAQGILDIDSIHVTCNQQYIDIKGKASKDPGDVITLTLQDIDLDYVFDALNINHVDFGGRARGFATVADVFSKNPQLRIDGMKVKGMKYNDAVMGDATIDSYFDAEQKKVIIDAQLEQYNNLRSRVFTEIYPFSDSLYIDVDAHRANAAFMRPFMAAFASDINGEVSGKVAILGNFHRIDLIGDAFANSLDMRINYTNVHYSCSDSVHFASGKISMNNVEVRDRDGHTALLNGTLTHRFFSDLYFNFRITDVKDMLCYDTNSDINPNWYGTIYGNGSAFITGAPGKIDINVSMQTAPLSKFTLVLNDTQEAAQYNFITFNDRNKPHAEIENEEQTDTLPAIVKQIAQQNANKQEDAPTIYNINLQADITPEAQLTLVMDPVGGDKIRAIGSGNLRMTYDNRDERLGIYGKYTLEKGSYNFTLQDIIIKDFTIMDGSAISFRGDPNDATLDIKAMYSLNANLRDLDESFANDRDMNRTNVPVHALLLVNGSMNQPDISFDLEFPTLTAESHRKIMSVISTEDMLNRQIIYLLALNRFYTPDYMSNSTRNNQFTSVASSTISSQLSNMLGQLNENWSIAPNFRSDRGDFSDMEVDLALSSQLLNNRLIFNGNFGYRDNAYSTRSSNFIGDFDLEYLLNPKGTLRLKAYNHFNDQNYYVRNAMTTQGVGIVFKHDFDRLFDFMRSKPDTAITVSPATRNHTIQVSDSLKNAVAFPVRNNNSNEINQ